ncbi:hypothetical protein EPO44_18475 [bacterium]|nr:hypothetical protein [Sphingopyxis sp.]TAJ80536.1 MAG: hypothetical protein EPO44_18475 [bacterium]
MTDEEGPKSWWHRRNWWKMGFFTALIAFEIAREIIVVQADAQAQPNVNFNLFRYQDFTAATGVWKRTDKNEKMTPTVIKIECEQSRGSCTMVDTHMNELWVFEPNIQTFDARFTSDSITFADESAACVTLKFRVDFAMKKVNAIREKKVNPDKGFPCDKMEDRLDLTLADSGYDTPDIGEHFVPLISGLLAVTKLF